MLGEINKKHVVLSMGNGHVLEGFVENMSDVYLCLVETNNQKVIVNIKDISFARLGAVPVPMYRPQIEEEPIPYPSASEEYSMSLPRPDNPYPRPELTRLSTRSSDK